MSEIYGFQAILNIGEILLPYKLNWVSGCLSDRSAFKSIIN